MPRGEFKHRYLFFVDAPIIGRNVSVIWKDLLWSSDSYLLLKYRGGCIIPLFQTSVWCEKCVAARHYAVICKQLLNANDINRVRWVVLDLLQDGACTDFFENLSENSSKGDLSNATTFNPPLFSLVYTFKVNKVASLSCRGRLSPNFFLYRVVDVSSNPETGFMKVEFRCGFLAIILRFLRLGASTSVFAFLKNAIMKKLSFRHW